MMYLNTTNLDRLNSLYYNISHLIFGFFFTKRVRACVLKKKYVHARILNLHAQKKTLCVKRRDQRYMMIIFFLTFSYMMINIGRKEYKF